MKKNNTISRRSYLKQALAFAGTALGALALQACGQSDSKSHSKSHSHTPAKNKNAVVNCDDTSSLTDAQVQQRATVNYTKTSPMFGKQCDNCEHYVASKTKDCGTCHVVPGPIDAKGYCILYSSI